VVRIVLENVVRLPLEDTLTSSNSITFYKLWSGPVARKSELETALEVDGTLSAHDMAELEALRKTNVQADPAGFSVEESAANITDLLSFFADRLKQYLRDQGKRHDLIDAVFALGEDDLVLITKRVEALGDFLGTEDGKNLLAGYKRAANILKAEEKKGALPEKLVVDGALIDAGPEVEVHLHQTLGQVRRDIEGPLAEEDFAAVMTLLAKLRGPVDAFFEQVMVNDENKQVRANRLALLNDIRETLHRVADFSLIEG
jgi:glycyl-tRNA synthetase beta chain